MREFCFNQNTHNIFNIRFTFVGFFLNLIMRRQFSCSRWHFITLLFRKRIIPNNIIIIVDGFTTEAPYNEVITHSAIYTVYLIELYANYSYRPRILIAELNDLVSGNQTPYPHTLIKQQKYKKQRSSLQIIRNIIIHPVADRL